MAKNRVEQVFSVANSFFQHDTFTITYDRFKKVSDELFSAFKKIQDIKSNTLLYRTSPHAITFSGFSVELAKKTEEVGPSRLNDVVNLRDLYVSKNHFNATCIELMIMFHQAVQLLKLAKHEKQIQGANELIHDLISKLAQYHVHLKNAYSFAEQLTWLKKIQELFLSKNFKNKDDFHNVLRMFAIDVTIGAGSFSPLNAYEAIEEEGFDQSFNDHNKVEKAHPEIKEKIDTVLAKNFQPLIDFVLSDTHIFANVASKRSACKHILSSIKSEHMRIFNTSKASYINAVYHNELLNFAFKNAATGMRDYLSYENVSWLNRVKGFTLPNFYTFPTLAVELINSLTLLSMAVYPTLHLYMISVNVSMNGDKLTEEEKDEYLNETWMSVVTGVLCLVLVYAHHKYVYVKDLAKRPFYVFSSTYANTEDLFKHERDWTPAESMYDMTLVDMPKAPEDAPKAPEDAPKAPEDTPKAPQDNSPKRVPMTHLEKLARVESAYSSVVKYVKSNSVQPDELFCPKFAFFHDDIKNKLTESSAVSQYFNEDEFQSEDFRNNLINKWDELLVRYGHSAIELTDGMTVKRKRVEKVKRIQDVDCNVKEKQFTFVKPSTVKKSVLTFSGAPESSPNRLLNDLMACVRRAEFDYSRDDINGDNKLESLLSLKYDVMMICNALCRIQKEAPALYGVVISKESGHMPEEISATLSQDDTCSNDDVRREYYVMVLKQLHALKDFDFHQSSSVSICLKPLPANDMKFDLTTFAMNRLDAYHQLINNKTNNKAVVMAISGSYLLFNCKKVHWNAKLPIGHKIVSDPDVMTRYQHVHQAVEDGSIADVATHEDAQYLLENKHVLYEVKSNKNKPNM